MEESGPLRVSLLAEGNFFAQSCKPALSFKACLAFFASSPTVRVELQVRNPQAALHPGGLWDLGDPGSFIFNDLSIQLQPAGTIQQLEWYAEAPNQVCSVDPDEWTLYHLMSGRCIRTPVVEKTGIPEIISTVLAISQFPFVDTESTDTTTDNPNDWPRATAQLQEFV